MKKCNAVLPDRVYRNGSNFVGFQKTETVGCFQGRLAVSDEAG